MTDTNTAGTAPAATAIVEIQGSDKQSGSVADAVRALISFREKQRETPVSQASEAETPAPETPSGEQPEASTPEPAPTGEATESADTANEPPIEPPRSWTKEAKERFSSLPRDTQEYLAQRESERDRDISRRQNETAEQRKAFEAERAKVEQARQQYETALPALMQSLQAQQTGDFADIKTIDDVTRLSQTDWPRYIQWDAAQKRLAAVQQQVQAAEQRQNQEKHQKLADFVKGETELLQSKIPELADPVKGPALRQAAVAVLKDIGFTDTDLSDLWQGSKEISLHDHRLQLLIRDGVRYREAQKAAKTINGNAKPLPPVQRPGVTQGKGALQHANLENLNKRLEQSGSIKDAVRLLQERRRAG